MACQGGTAGRVVEAYLKVTSITLSLGLDTVRLGVRPSPKSSVRYGTFSPIVAPSAQRQSPKRLRIGEQLPGLEVLRGHSSPSAVPAKRLLRRLLVGLKRIVKRTLPRPRHLLHWAELIELIGHNFFGQPSTSSVPGLDLDGQLLRHRPRSHEAARCQ